MRRAPVVVLVASACVLALGLAWAQRAPIGLMPSLPGAPQPQPSASAPSAVQSAAVIAPAAPAASTQAPAATPPAAAPAVPPAPAAAAIIPKCDNPNALGVARTVEIDTTGGPGFGFEHFKQHDFLRNNEVVLTFDDGPWPTTPHVLEALAAECVRATFFPIGKHATYHPEILKQVVAAGHTVGSHTWSHRDLSKKTTVQEAKDEIEKGISAVRWALGAPASPFFRFPALRHPPELVTYLGQRNIGIFSTDMDSFDFKMRKSDQVIDSVMAKLKKHGKGIVLMHDFQQSTAQAVPELLTRLKAEGYKVVHMRAKFQINTLPQYDEALLKENKLQTVTTRATTSIVRTVD